MYKLSITHAFHPFLLHCLMQVQPDTTDPLSGSVQLNNRIFYQFTCETSLGHACKYLEFANLVPRAFLGEKALGTRLGVCIVNDDFPAEVNVCVQAKVLVAFVSVILRNSEVDMQRVGQVRMRKTSHNS